jgi:hypothetical protein
LPSYTATALRAGASSNSATESSRRRSSASSARNALAAKFDLKSLLGGTDYEQLRRNVDAVVNK